MPPLLTRFLSVLILVFASGNAHSQEKEMYYYLDLFGNIFERIRADYVEEVSDKALIEAAIQGMLSSLDPHSSYLSPEAYEAMQIRTLGEFGGLGIEVTKQGNYIRVVAPIDDTPAFHAGLQPGDLISHIEGESVANLTIGQAVERMRGEPGTSITLTIIRGDDEISQNFNVTLTRAVIKISPVRTRIEEDIGYLRITQFNQKASQDLKTKISELFEQAPLPLKGFILDLRNNPGGLLDEAVKITDIFLTQGEIVTIKDRQQNQSLRYNANPGDLIQGLPLIILINSGSASASEIVAGALQDHKRAVIVGTTSFGKGSVQTIIPLGFEDGAIRMTTARYYTPSGDSIQLHGVTPDILIEQARLESIPETQPREASEERALDNDQELLEPSQASIAHPEDYQLTRAIDLLRGVWLFNQRLTQE